MFSRESMQDSYTLDNYIYFMTRREEHQIREEEQTGVEKKEREQSSQKMINQSKPLMEIEKTEYFSVPRRKMSTQLSIFSWLVKDKPQQTSLLLQLDKSLILKIYSYLRLSQTVIASRGSSYLFSCYKHLWIDKNYFEMFQTDKLTSQELNKVMEKSRLQHIKQLKFIYQGKNIKKNRQKQSLSLYCNQNQDEAYGWQCKQKHNVRDICDFSQIEDGQCIHYGLSSLKYSQLFLQRSNNNRTPSMSIYKEDFLNFSMHVAAKISHFLQLVLISLSLNRYVTTQSLIPILKRCPHLKRIQLSQCKNIDENIFKYLRHVEGLEVLGLKNFRQSFGNVGLLKECEKLVRLDIDDSLINDDEFMTCVREVKTIKYLSIQGCLLLTDICLDFLLERVQRKDWNIRQIIISRINTMNNGKIQQLEQKLYQISLEKYPVD